MENWIYLRFNLNIEIVNLWKAFAFHILIQYLRKAISLKVGETTNSEQPENSICHITTQLSYYVLKKSTLSKHWKSIWCPDYQTSTANAPNS